jgi:hypothetical protein
MNQTNMSNWGGLLGAADPNLGYTYSLGSVNTAGTIIAGTGSGYSDSMGYYNVNSSSTSPGLALNPSVSYPTIGINQTSVNHKLKVEGDAEINGKLKVHGKDLSVMLEKIEERLGILFNNPELESRWEELRKLREQYIALEKDLLEKEKIMEILKR